ncbi:ketopantoate reductase family protein [Radiobacillus sp. PE A8.2]|uniref:ketopantoate reductase family protein n=1 Tax=Radiobacillus sp. PE A8.2 TaxID=3380349 RepID=UPI00388E516B
MAIEKVSVIGLGALGILFGNQLSKRIPKQNLSFIADRERVNKYQSEGIYCNDERCDFNFETPDEATSPADLIIIAVKYNGLQKALDMIKHHVGEDTIILSALNGISSEEIIGQRYGFEKVLFCVAQGMDAVKEGNKLTYKNAGMLSFGEREPNMISEKVERVAEFFEEMDFPYELETHMLKRQWGKFMLNVGVNQTVAVYESNYAEIQKHGKARVTMIAAMREVIQLSEQEGIYLTEADLDYWLDILATLNPDGKPSMRQDLEAKRYSEVQLFAGTVLELGKKHSIPTPINRELYEKIKLIENQY